MSTTIGNLIFLWVLDFKKLKQYLALGVSHCLFKSPIFLIFAFDLLHWTNINNCLEYTGILWKLKQSKYRKDLQTCLYYATTLIFPHKMICCEVGMTINIVCCKTTLIQYRFFHDWRLAISTLVWRGQEIMRTLKMVTLLSTHFTWVVA